MRKVRGHSGRNRKVRDWGIIRDGDEVKTENRRSSKARMK